MEVVNDIVHSRTWTAMSALSRLALSKDNLLDVSHQLPEGVGDIKA